LEVLAVVRVVCICGEVLEVSSEGKVTCGSCGREWNARRIGRGVWVLR